MKYIKLSLLSLFLIISASNLFAQGPRGNSFGFGLILGDPTGATIKYWTNNENAFTASIGSSYFGNIRLGGDYLWHFDAFNSRVVKMYAGPGIVLGFGQSHGGFWWGDKHDKFYYWDDTHSVGFAGRVVFGINIIPKRSPIEIFFELGPLIGISPAFGVNLDAAAGIRFYP
jgi:hypothetical protein